MVNPRSLFVISAPSGAGKTSLVRELLARSPDFGVAISHTTRPPRPGEKSGQHYHFISEDQFRQMVKEERFVEHANVFGHLYGTSKEAIAALRDEGRDILLEIDWQGAQQVRSRLPDCLSVFILPPSRATLRARLHARGQDDPSVIDRRVDASFEELSHYHDFDFLIVNEDFEQALLELESIIRRQPPELRRAAQEERLKELLAQLLSG